MLLNGDPGGFVCFWRGLPEKGAQFFLGGSELHRNYGMVVILLYFLCNYDDLKTKLNLKNAATLIKDSFLLADSKLKMYQEWVLLL